MIKNRAQGSGKRQKRLNVQAGTWHVTLNLSLKMHGNGVYLPLSLWRSRIEKLWDIIEGREQKNERLEKKGLSFLCLSDLGREKLQHMMTKNLSVSVWIYLTHLALRLELLFQFPFWRFFSNQHLAVWLVCILRHSDWSDSWSCLFQFKCLTRNHSFRQKEVIDIAAFVKVSSWQI